MLNYISVLTLLGTWGRVGLDFGKNVTKFYVTNWEGRVGSDPNMYDVTLFTLFFFNSSLRYLRSRS